jgi:hypothetical protein
VPGCNGDLQVMPHTGFFSPVPGPPNRFLGGGGGVLEN